MFILDDMTVKYTTRPVAAPRISEMPVITATELKNTTADVFDQVASRHAVAITRHDKPRAVLLSIEQYETLTGQHPDWLEELRAKCQDLLERMQSPEQRAGAERAFNATPEELGEAALRGAQRRARECVTAKNGK